MKLSTYLLIGGICASALGLALMLISGYASDPMSIYVTPPSFSPSADNSSDSIIASVMDQTGDTIAIPVEVITTPAYNVKMTHTTTATSSTSATTASSTAPTVTSVPEPAAPLPDLTVTRDAPVSNFNVVAFSETRPTYRFKIENFKGYAVRESPSVKAPKLIADEEWAKAVSMKRSMHTLKVDIDIRRLTDAYGPYFRARHFCPVTIVVPKGWLHGASVGTRTLYLDSIQADKFVAVSAGRITLNDCRFNQLNCMGRHLDELKFDNSTAVNVDIAAISPRFLLTGTDSRSVATNIDISAVSSGSKAEIRVNDLRIDRLRWNPTNPNDNTQITVSSQIPLNFIR
ncbi:MAG: hypothetical protein K2K49_05480 [Duncaniella sp.]|nr:hypothetical protein [Duncaniella sp.]